MAKVKVTEWKWRCERCGHEWIPRDWQKLPTACPDCKNPYWATPRKFPKKPA